MWPQIQNMEFLVLHELLIAPVNMKFGVEEQTTGLLSQAKFSRNQ